MPIANTCSIGYPHDGRADNAAYRHDRRADNAAYRHDRRADSRSRNYHKGFEMEYSYFQCLYKGKQNSRILEEKFVFLSPKRGKKQLMKDWCSRSWNMEAQFGTLTLLASRKN